LGPFAFVAASQKCRWLTCFQFTLLFFSFIFCGSVMDFDCRLAVGSEAWPGDLEKSRPLAADQKMKMMMMTIIATAEASWPANLLPLLWDISAFNFPLPLPLSVNRSVVWLGHFL